MADWRITRKAGTCGTCEREFIDGERHYSVLRTTEEGLERTDTCSKCRDGQASGSEEELFWWATRYQAEVKRTVQLDLESLERLFVELEGKDEGRVAELRYVLCLILMRKRRLKVERVLRTADGEAFRVKRPRKDERYEVKIFDFTPERMAEIRTELQAIFDGAESLDGGQVAVEESEVAESDAAEAEALPESEGEGDSAEDSSVDSAEDPAVDPAGGEAPAEDPQAVSN